MIWNDRIYHREAYSKVHSFGLDHITNLFFFSKIIEKIMHKRLLSFLKNHSIISNKQNVFCRGKLTNTAIAEFTKRFYKSLDEKKLSIGLFLDLSKAFNLVDHDIYCYERWQEWEYEGWH
jgi:hypothetical protein